MTRIVKTETVFSCVVCTYTYKEHDIIELGEDKHVCHKCIDKIVLGIIGRAVLDKEAGMRAIKAFFPEVVVKHVEWLIKQGEERKALS